MRGLGIQDENKEFKRVFTVEAQLPLEVETEKQDDEQEQDTACNVENCPNCFVFL